MSTNAITYELAGTINLENYENIRVNFGFTGEILNGESKEDAVDRIAEFVESNWRSRAEKAVEQFRDTVG